MRPYVLIIAAVLAAPAAHGQVFEGQLHTGSARVASDPAVTWSGVGTRVTGSLFGGTNSSASWDIGLLDPQRIRVNLGGFAGSLGSNNASGSNTMSFTLTEPTVFLLSGSLSSTLGNISFRLSGPGISGVPLQPDGSLRLTAAGPVTLSGLLLPGVYLIQSSGSCSSAGIGNPGSFGSGLKLSIAPPTRVALVVQVGEPIGDGVTVSDLHYPCTNALGQPGFVFSCSDESRGIWIGDGPVFNSGSVAGLSGSETVMGLSDAGAWIYSPFLDGNEAVYTDAGPLLVATNPIPDLPGLFSSFSTFTRMSASGTAYWIGGFTSTPGGSTQGHVFHRNATPSNPAATESVFRSGDLISGLAITSTGVVSNYDISEDGTRLINEVRLGTDTATDSHLIIDGGTVVAREGSPVFPGAAENWQNFRNTGVNNAGNYVVGGDTNARPDMDGFLAYNGALIARETGILDGRTLAGEPLALAIDNANRIAFTWQTSLGKTIFYGDAADPGSLRALLTVGEMIDTDGDGTGDFILTDFNSFILDLADVGLIYANVNIAPPGEPSAEAIVGFARCRADWNADGTVNSRDISSFLTSWLQGVQNPGLVADFNRDFDVNSGDISAFLTQWIADVSGGC